jgi:hypothetical protein
MSIIKLAGHILQQPEELHHVQMFHRPVEESAEMDSTQRSCCCHSPICGTQARDMSVC